MTDCNHEFIGKKGVKCGEDAGHKGTHICYLETFSDKNETCYSIHEWNDSGESPIDHSQVEKGRAFPCNYDDGHDERQKIMGLAIFDAKKSLKKGVVFEIRAKSLPSGDMPDYSVIKRTREEMAEKWGIAWYHIPKVNQPEGFEDFYKPTPEEPLFQNDVDEGKEDELGGYILLARIKS